MGDRLDQLEAELASLRPAAVSAELRRAIHHDLHEPQHWSIADRCLAGAMSIGAVAACVIGGIVAWQIIPGAQASRQMPPPVVAQHNEPPAAGPTLGQYQQALARAGTSAELF